MELGPELGPTGDPGGSLEARKLRRVNKWVDGYEPGGRRFESCRARHSPNNLAKSSHQQGVRKDFWLMTSLEQHLTHFWYYAGIVVPIPFRLLFQHPARHYEIACTIERLS